MASASNPLDYGPSSAAGFEEFFVATEPLLRQLLVARLGAERGREATAEALLWALEHWERARTLRYPVRYLGRVGVSKTRARKQAGLPQGNLQQSSALMEPGLQQALQRLSRRQREAVVLVCAYEWRLIEVARATGSSVSSVNTHLRRGLVKLRLDLGVNLDTPSVEPT